MQYKCNYGVGMTYGIGKIYCKMEKERHAVLARRKVIIKQLTHMLLCQQQAQNYAMHIS